MVFLYGELLVLLLVSFLIGSGFAAVVVRLVVRQTADSVSTYVADAGGRR
jgi:hypothetical protein